jgi:hypothetical protein
MMRRLRMLARRRVRASRGPFAFSSRHHAFAARLRGGLDAGARAPAVGYVLRRMAARVLRHVRSPLHFALQLIHRTSVHVGAPRRGPAGQSARLAAPGTHERLRVVMRLLERATLASHFRESRPLLGAALPRPSTAAMTGTAESVNGQWIERIERQSLYPRVTQVVARAAAPVVPRNDSNMQATSETMDVRAVSRPATSHAVTQSAAALPPAELSRVTDHVIRQLDRRVLSYRERMGRV